MRMIKKVRDHVKKHPIKTALTIVGSIGIGVVGSKYLIKSISSQNKSKPFNESGKSHICGIESIWEENGFVNVLIEGFEVRDFGRVGEYMMSVDNRISADATVHALIGLEK